LKETLRQLDAENLLPLLGDARVLQRDDEKPVSSTQEEAAEDTVFRIRTVAGEMRFDTARVVVEAGKPFELVFENDDHMPHNLVILTADSRPVIGPLADRMLPDEL